MSENTKPELPIVHCLVVGVTQSGKTTLAHAMAHEESEKKEGKREIIVYDPVGTETAQGHWPDGTIYFDDNEEFLEYLSKRQEGRDCLLFIDEADDVMSHRYPENTMIIRRARHHNIQVVLITQRPHLLSPSARTQCGVCFMFRLSKQDADNIGREFGHNGISEVDLDRGEFLVLQSGEKVIDRGDVFKLKKGVLLWAASDGNTSSAGSSSSSRRTSSLTASRRSRG